MDQVTRKVKFFLEQYNAFNFTTQFGAAIAGVQSGKTFLGSALGWEEDY
jgi:hypothetical protein